MALKVFWTDEANEGLDDIIDYLERNWNTKEITLFFSRLDESIKIISEAPHRYKNSLRKPGTKEFHTLLRRPFFIPMMKRS